MPDFCANFDSLYYNPSGLWPWHHLLWNFGVAD